VQQGCRDSHAVVASAVDWGAAGQQGCDDSHAVVASAVDWGAAVQQGCGDSHAVVASAVKWGAVVQQGCGDLQWQHLFQLLVSTAVLSPCWEIWCRVGSSGAGNGVC
jgi:hypothetical protein